MCAAVETYGQEEDRYKPNQKGARSLLRRGRHIKPDHTQVTLCTQVTRAPTRVDVAGGRPLHGACLAALRDVRAAAVRVLAGSRTAYTAAQPARSQTARFTIGGLDTGNAAGAGADICRPRNKKKDNNGEGLTVTFLRAKQGLTGDRRRIKSAGKRHHHLSAPGTSTTRTGLHQSAGP